jgi:RHH-type proline utilization regulon transcriptional repressor/proline dehydrogenase/delta 1-pyrroline-5-carboxylate dehydrogenase
MHSHTSLHDLTFADENVLAETLIAGARLSDIEKQRIETIATQLVKGARERDEGGIDAFMVEYGLSTNEGVVLMCLAEALLRIPDADTADAFISDKLSGQNWSGHRGHSDSLFVNASTWGLMLTGRIIALGKDREEALSATLKRLFARSSEPVIRKALKAAMRIMGRQFVLGRTIEEALKNGAADEVKGYRFSYDMLGEAAVTQKDAARYLQSYSNAIAAISTHAQGQGDVFSAPSISVKLSALHPRYEARQEERIFEELYPRLVDLAGQAKAGGVGLTLDAEEADRLSLMCKIFEKLAHEPSLMDWNGLGLAVQAYGKRAVGVIENLIALAEKSGRILPVRLVKGAYWDSEIKRAQESGYEDYPVFTRKIGTDTSYLACALLMLERRDVLYPQFATHNAHTIAAIHTLAGNENAYEFQRLHGMGQSLYAAVVTQDTLSTPCRIYAPVGTHEDLLAYLVRRLLENGANTSFVNRLADREAPISGIIADPVEQLAHSTPKRHPLIPLPKDIFQPERENSPGFALWEETVRCDMVKAMKSEQNSLVEAGPLVKGARGAERVNITTPHDRRIVIGSVLYASEADADLALEHASKAQPAWDALGGAKRADILEKAAALFIENKAVLLNLLVMEAGKTMDNAVADWREAIDFLRYYAARAREEFQRPFVLPGPTGERNEMSMHGRGIFACISPWNFPLAIFTGQVSAALAAGNAVAAKPADPTPLIAYEAVRLMHRAGVPQDVLALLPGRGRVVGAKLIEDKRVSGVAFTGSNATAAHIQQELSKRGGAIVPFIAETGGLNAMIIDSTALIEAAVKDTVRSAFDSTGQRCSALRIVYVQEDIAERYIEMLTGAMDELKIGDPQDYATDVGPVINQAAVDTLEAHKQKMRLAAKRVLKELTLPKECEYGTFVAPAAYELKNPGDLTEEVFGPILHLVRWRSGEIRKVCEHINAPGYGLTLGLHTRIESVAQEVRQYAKVGNLYVNRNQIGAVVGVQPFGGEGLSGTGPKAGGPHYLHRFAVERVVSTDITASGGNATLLNLSDR